MSDNRRRFVAIHKAIKKLYPTQPRGNTARHLTTLAMLISGIVASKSVNLPAIAGKVPAMTKVDSQVKRFSRWVDNQRVDYECYYLPYAQQLVASLAHQSGLVHEKLVLIMDGSAVGRGCRTLMLSVVYKNRALPLAWLVAEGSKGGHGRDAMDSGWTTEALLPLGSAEPLYEFRATTGYPPHPARRRSSRGSEVPLNEAVLAPGRAGP